MTRLEAPIRRLAESWKQEAMRERGARAHTLSVCAESLLFAINSATDDLTDNDTMRDLDTVRRICGDEFEPEDMLREFRRMSDERDKALTFLRSIESKRR